MTAKRTAHRPTRTKRLWASFASRTVRRVHEQKARAAAATHKRNQHTATRMVAQMEVLPAYSCGAISAPGSEEAACPSRPLSSRSGIRAHSAAADAARMPMALERPLSEKRGDTSPNARESWTENMTIPMACARPVEQKRSASS